MIDFYIEELKRFYHYKLGHLYSSKYPSISAIELTNFCNSACEFCPHKTMKRKKEHMKFETFKKIIDEISTYPQGLIWTHMFGEPLLHPNLFEFITYAKNKGIKIGISTNCFLLNYDNSKKILENDVDNVILCLDGATKDTYEKLRVGLIYDDVRQNIINFLRMKGDRRKPYVQLQFVENVYNKNEVNAFKKEWKNVREIDEVRILKSSDWAGQVDEKFNSKKIRNMPCGIPWHYLAIHSDGNITFCCADVDAKIKLGNIKNTTLKEAWDGDILGNMRKSHLKGTFINGLCDNCKERRGY